LKILSIEITGQDIAGLKRWFHEAWQRLFVPKNKQGHIGIVLALKTEGDKAKQRLKNDFLSELRNYLANCKIHSITVIEYDNALSERIDGPQAAGVFLQRSRAHMIVYGSLSQRKIHGEDNYVFRLHGFVRHAPIPTHVSQLLAKEFASVLPSRIAFPEGEEMLGFELTRQWIGLVVKFIVALAALVSGSPSLANQLLKELQHEIPEVVAENEAPIVAELRERLPLRRIDALTSVLIVETRKFAHTRDRKYVLDLWPSFSELLELDPTNLSAKLTKAMWLFFNGQTPDAIKVFGGETSKEVAWRYSLGFLLAYDGEIASSLEQYRRAFNAEVGTELLCDIVMFVTEVIEKEPSKSYLRFFRGAIKFRATRDYKGAQADFLGFLNSHDAGTYPKLSELAKNYLVRIENHIGT
jgi:hypothetical protein